VTTSQRRVTVLLVDQDRRVRAALGKLLSAVDSQWDVSAVAVLPALLATTGLPDVALIDVPMTTAAAVLSAIAELTDAAVAVVAISAYDALRGRVLEAGASTYLSKDANTDLIVQAVRAAAHRIRLASAPPAV